MPRLPRLHFHIQVAWIGFSKDFSDGAINRRDILLFLNIDANAALVRIL